MVTKNITAAPAGTDSTWKPKQKRTKASRMTKLSLITMLLLFSSDITQKAEATHWHGTTNTSKRTNTLEKKDDWILDEEQKRGGAAQPPRGARKNSQMFHSTFSAGFSTGGSKDINNFRENIKQGFTPRPQAITHEGIFYDYYFKIGSHRKGCEELLCPTYDITESLNPLTQKKEYYMAIGLNSGKPFIPENRKKLNLVVVLDISGSMDSSVNNYYYDHSRGGKANTRRRESSKLEAAKSALRSITRQLKKDDRLGIVVFDHNSYIAKPLNIVGGTDMAKIRSHINRLEAKGGTNFEAGYKAGSSLFSEAAKNDPDSENRIIMITDGMPNRGQIEEDGLFGMTEKASRTGIFSTFIGVGVDFNSEATEAITKTKGANYFSIRSTSEFHQLVNENFNYMVSPMAFNLSLELKSQGVGIQQVFGSPEASESQNSILRVKTLFAAKTSPDGTRGGVVLLRLDNNPFRQKIAIKTSYEERDGSRHEYIEQLNTQSYASKRDADQGARDTRKVLLLTRYAELLKEWSASEHLLDTQKDAVEAWGTPCQLIQRKAAKNCHAKPNAPTISRWEIRSVPLMASKANRQILTEFLDYFNTEAQKINDKSLEKEKSLLKRIINATTASNPDRE